MRWSERLVRVLLQAKGLYKVLTAEERRAYQQLNETYLSNLRRACFRRLLGYVNLPKLAQKFQVKLEDLQAVVDVLFQPELKDLRRWAYHYALDTTLRYGKIEPVQYYDALTAEIVNRAIHPRVIRRRTKFLQTYDPSLSLEDLVAEVRITVLRAVQKNVGLSDPERLLHYASSSAKNALTNVLHKYTTQKRARLRSSDSPHREYEATVISLPTATPSEAWEKFNPRTVDLTLASDPILLNRARRYFLTKERFAWRKVRFLDLLSEGYSWEQAASMVELSAASQWRVRQVLFQLLRQEESGTSSLRLVQSSTGSKSHG